jgi:hemolysin III
MHAVDAATLILLLTGGALYTIGLVFHLWERLPFQTVIWHAFVVAAAAVHFAAVVVSVAGTTS